PMPESPAPMTRTSKCSGCEVAMEPPHSLVRPGTKLTLATLMVPSSTKATMSGTTSGEALSEGEYRDRLLAATLEGIGDVGWADLTIAEIVRRARVSKRTFYEHFETREGCLLALYESVSSRVLDELDSAVERIPRGEGRIEAGAAFYLTR